MRIKDLDFMSEAQQEEFWAAFEKILESDDGAAAKRHLAEGRPIYYCDDRYPNEIVREWPDGRRELVQVDNEGRPIVLGQL